MKQLLALFALVLVGCGGEVERQPLSPEPLDIVVNAEAGERLQVVAGASQFFELGPDLPESSIMIGPGTTHLTFKSEKETVIFSARELNALGWDTTQRLEYNVPLMTLRNAERISALEERCAIDEPKDGGKEWHLSSSETAEVDALIERAVAAGYSIKPEGAAPRKRITLSQSQEARDDDV